MTEKTNDLQDHNDKLALVRDRVRGVALQGQAGFYLYGRAGTSKTYTVRTTLDDLNKSYHYHIGHLTPIGLFQLIAENPNKILILDDIGQIFSSPIAKAILLAALGTQPSGFREVSYRKANETLKVRFTGSIIAISNLQLHGDGVMEAIKSRIQTLHYNPTDEQITALMWSICNKGYHSCEQEMTPSECGQVCEFLLERCTALGLRPDLRMLVDKAFADFVLWRQGDTETHWEDLVNSSLEDQLVTLTHPVTKNKQQEEADELRLLQDLLKTVDDYATRVNLFCRRTGKTIRTYQRRMRQIKERAKQVDL